MGRLPGFDYRQPLYYMVTLKKRPGLPDFAVLAPPGAPPPPDALGRPRWLAPHDTTRALSRTIRSFHETLRGLAPIKAFAVMPDHIHLLLKIENIPDRLPLGTYVWQLERALTRSYWPLHAPPPSSPLSPSSKAAPVPPIFDPSWHDWIVLRRGQLAAFSLYIRENPERAWRRRENRRYFTRPGTLSFAGRDWHAYGNPALLQLPVLEPFRCSRSWAEAGPEWRAALLRASRTGPGGAGVGTFLSPCEKACGNAIHQAGGALVVLASEGFSARWHPTRAKEALCAAGRMLFLSLWPPQAARPDNATLHRRCHEMGDLLLAALCPSAADGAAAAQPGHRPD